MFLKIDLIFNFFLKIKIDCSSVGVFGPNDVIQSYSSIFDGQGFKISGITFETEQDNFGLIRTMTNGGVIKNLTIESSSMTISGANNATIGFFVGIASASNEPGNITISDCHSIKNTIVSSSDIFSVGFIAGNLENNQQPDPPNQIPFILVSDCSTKYSNFRTSGENLNNLSNLGGNFGFVGIYFLKFFTIF